MLFYETSEILKKKEFSRRYFSHFLFFKSYTTRVLYPQKNKKKKITENLMNPYIFWCWSAFKVLQKKNEIKFFNKGKSYLRKGVVENQNEKLYNYVAR